MLQSRSMTAEPVQKEAVPPADYDPPASMAKRAKRLSLAVARSAGAFGILKSSSWRRRRLLVLAYHGISLNDEHLWDCSLFISPERFRRRMEILRHRGYSVLSLEEGLRRAAANDLPPASAAITFDDGFYDFYAAALPVLESLQLPATLYLTTYYSQKQKPIFDVAMSYILWKSGRAAENARWQAFALENHLSTEGKQELLERLAAEVHFDIDSLHRLRLFHLMTPQEAADAARRGVDLQLHTHRHRTPIDRVEFRREVDENRRLIEEIAGRPARHFCYPGGVYHANFFPWLRELDVISATTCEPGFTSSHTELMCTPRLVDGSGLTDDEFEGWLCGISAALPSAPPAR